MAKRPSPNDSRAVDLSILSDPKNLAVARTAAEQMAREEGFVPADVDGIVLAIDEALANIMRHGYEGRKDCEINIRMEAITGDDGRGGIRIILEDSGKQVDPKAIKGRDLDDVRPGGLGVHIIRTVMDDVEYRRLEQGGMQLQMVKYAGDREEPTT